MSAITTHVLDVCLGLPACGVAVVLERQTPTGWELIGSGHTDGDGRLRDLMPPGEVLKQANYRLKFDTGGYFAGQQIEGFYPEAAIAFTVSDVGRHYHVPLLLSPFGYSTYRGS